jgi:hypothetical protein
MVGDMTAPPPGDLDREAELRRIACKYPGHNLDFFFRLLDTERERVRALETELAEAREAKDYAYSERNQLVALLARLFPSGVKRTAIEGWEPEWQGCVYIDLPTGQASWHYHDKEAPLFADLPPYQGEWDGHSTVEKYHRVIRAALARPSPDAGER